MEKIGSLRFDVRLCTILSRCGTRYILLVSKYRVQNNAVAHLAAIIKVVYFCL